MVWWADRRDSDLLDHPAWFRRDRRYAAVVGQPYLSDVDIAETRARLVRRDLVLHLPPDPLASFHFPGWTLFVVITGPGVEVRWLPEQDGRLKGLWRGLGERLHRLSGRGRGCAFGGDEMDGMMSFREWLRTA